MKKRNNAYALSSVLVDHELTEIIIKNVCKEWGVDKDQLFIKNRRKDRCMARHTIRYLLRTFPENMPSLSTVAQITHSRDHCLILHAIKVVNNMIDTSFDFRQKLIAIKAKIKEEWIIVSDSEEMESFIYSLELN